MALTLNKLIPSPEKVVTTGVIVMIVLWLLKFMPQNLRNQLKY